MKLEKSSPITFPIALAIVAAALVAPSMAVGSRVIHDTADFDQLMGATVPHVERSEMGDRLEAPIVEKSAAATHVEVIGDFSGKPPQIVLLGPDGSEIYRTEPVHNRTIVAKNAIIPSITVRDKPGATTKLIVVSADEPQAAPDLELGQADESVTE